MTKSGVGTHIHGFIPSLYDLLEADLCIDTTREYATGMSNGGMMTYQLGVSLGTRLAAIVPVAGSFHYGFAAAPTVGVPVMDIHGTRDTTVPANTSNGGGWYYTVTSEIFGGQSKYSRGWKAANGCSGASRHYPTAYDGTQSLYCVSEGSCSGGDVVRCMWRGGHTFISVNGPLAWDFMSQWTKPSHVGFGCSDGEPCHKSSSVAVATAVGDAAPPIFEGVALLKQEARGHYGDPANGCLADEDIIPLAGGHTCAPRIDSSISPQHELSPQCMFGDVFPIRDNGCPTDADVTANSAAWPACVAKGNTIDPYTNGEFHCVLVCGPCNRADPVTAECEGEAHEMCPLGAKCRLGELRAISSGVCSFDIATQQIAI